MSIENALVVVLGLAGLGLAVTIAWRWRRLPAVAPRTLPDTRGASATDALRTLAGVVSAAAIAGGLVAGLGGRLLMRVLAATSGGGAQGKLTEAGEVVGDITLGGTIGLLLFIGVFVPVAAGLVYLVLRHFLPSGALVSGAVFGVLLLGTVGIAQPMAPDNVDFDILSPLWLAVVLIIGLAILFGMSFAVLAARFDVGLPDLGVGWRAVPAHIGLVICALPPFVLATVPYVALRTILHGRAGRLLDRPSVRKAGRLLVGLATAAAVAASVTAAAEIL